MAKRKRAHEAEPRPAPIPWEFAPHIPTEVFLGGADLTDSFELQQAVDNFIYWLELDKFLTWEAVVCYEHGRPLTSRQEKALDRLVRFEESDDDEILYIDECARPSEPWHRILNQIVPHLLIEPFKTSDVPCDVQLEGWLKILTALEDYGQGLSLPEAVSSPPEVIPTDLRHKLWLQYCFDSLSGLGQSDDLNLDDQTWRIDEFIERLRQCKAVVGHLSLTLDALLARLVLPERDRLVFLAKMQENLGLDSAQAPLADHL